MARRRKEKKESEEGGPECGCVRVPLLGSNYSGMRRRSGASKRNRMCVWRWRSREKEAKEEKKSVGGTEKGG